MSDKSSSSSSSYNSSDSWNWDGSDGESEFKTKCLFCEESYDLDNLLKHLKEKHSIEFNDLYNAVDGKQYSYFKLVNWIRKENKTVEEVKKVDKQWLESSESDAYLKPVIPTDGMLMLDANWKDNACDMVNVVDNGQEMSYDLKKELQELKEKETN